MKSVGSMVVLVIIVSLANTTWCGAQNDSDKLADFGYRPASEYCR